MSHREARRDTESKIHRSRFDRESSPKRSRRDEKSAPEKFPSSNNSDDKNKNDEYAQDTPLPADPKLENKARRKENDRNKDRELRGKKDSYNSTEGSRSRSNFQHNERGNPAQVDRSSGRDSKGDRGWWRDPTDPRNRRNENRNASDDTWRSGDRGKEHEKRKWGHEGFAKVEAQAAPARKRPAFREDKNPVEDSGLDGKAPTETRKSTHLDCPAEESWKEERRGNGRYLDRSQRPFGGNRALNRREAQRGVFPSRERYPQQRDSDSYKRGDRFGGRPGFQSGGDKWKHDLYHESDRSPTPKNEDDQIAKVEALLSL